MSNQGSDRTQAGVAAGLAALIVTVALVAQSVMPLNADAQWILTVAHRVLNGQRLYRDIVEINPPLVVWLQLPVVWLSDISSIGAATVLRFAIAMLAVGVAYAVYRVPAFPSGNGARASVWTIPALLGVTLILPGQAFGQREQIISMLFLPYLATVAARVNGRSVSAAGATFAGVGAGVAIALKPHFILVWLLVSGYRAASAPRRKSAFEPEDLGITVIGLVYVAAVRLFAPEFLSLTRTYGAAYLAYTTMTRWQLIGQSAAIIWLVIAVVAWRVRSHGSVPAAGAGAVLALAGAGAAGAAVWQGKGWTYHFLPTETFAFLLGLVALFVAPHAGRRRSQAAARHLAAALLLASWVPLIAGVVWQLASGREGTDARVAREQRELKAAVALQGGSRSILVLSSDMTAAQPWIEEGGLVSRNSLPCLWVPAVVYHTRWNGNPRVAFRRPPAMSAAERAAYTEIVNDLTRHPPDLLVVESRKKNQRFTGYPGGFDHLAYYGTDPHFAACLRQYHPVALLSGFEILRKRSRGDGPAAGRADASVDDSRGCA